MLQCAPSQRTCRKAAWRAAKFKTLRVGAEAMTPERRKLARRAFEKALKLAPAQRSAFVEGEFADDAELRAEVESLLASHEAAHATEAEVRHAPRNRSRPHDARRLQRNRKARLGRHGHHLPRAGREARPTRRAQDSSRALRARRGVRQALRA